MQPDQLFDEPAERNYTKISTNFTHILFIELSLPYLLCFIKFIQQQQQTILTLFYELKQSSISIDFQIFHSLILTLKVVPNVTTCLDLTFQF